LPRGKGRKLGIPSLPEVELHGVTKKFFSRLRQLHQLPQWLYVHIVFTLLATKNLRCF
jgi:hypothetical protein